MVMEEPEVGPDALKTSSRVMAIRTGRSVFFRQRNGDGFHIHDGLAAESAANFRRVDLQIR